MTVRKLSVVSGEGSDPIAEQIVAEIKNLRTEIEKTEKNGNGNGGIYVSKFWAGILGLLVGASILAAAGTYLEVQVIQRDYVTELELQRAIVDADNSEPRRGAERRLQRLERFHPPGNQP